MKQYNYLERPVVNESEPLLLTFGITLQQIIDVVRLVGKLSKGNILFQEYGKKAAVRFLPSHTCSLALSGRKESDNHFELLVELSKSGIRSIDQSITHREKAEAALRTCCRLAKSVVRTALF